MTLQTFIIKGNAKPLSLLILLSLLAGGFHIGLLVLINTTLSWLISGKNVGGSEFTSALVLLVGYLLLSRLAIGVTAKFCLKIVHSVRMQLVRAALGASYIEMKNKQDLLYSAVTKDIVTLSQAIMGVTQFIISSLVVVGCLIYLAFLSLTVFIFIVAAIVLSTLVYLTFSAKSFKHIQSARESEEELFMHTRQLIDGFKEILLNHNKGDDLVEEALQSASKENIEKSYRGFSGFFNMSIIGQLLFYTVILFLLFASSLWLDLAIPTLVSCMIVTLFIVGPVENLTALIPRLAEGNVAANRLSEILSAFKQTVPITRKNTEKEDFQQLVYDGYHYQYDNKLETGFKVGPINFELKKGEITFIHGSNGAGKTTFVYLLLGLLEKQQGTSRLNQQVLDDSLLNYNLFSPVFSDFHLFDRFYGLKEVDLDKANEYLKRFELDKKVSLENGHFSTINLSTGQRKRLALIAILLERRPILVLDEWAADQDPAFRQKFYTEILPLLKQEGFTILAITHDDKYYHCADYLYRMDDGQLLRVTNTD